MQRKSINMFDLRIYFLKLNHPFSGIKEKKMHNLSDFTTE